MTLRLVHDAQTVAIERIGNITEELKTVELDPDVVTVVALLIREDGMTIRVIGEEASHYELMGLFEAAKLRVFADDAVED